MARKNRITEITSDSNNQDARFDTQNNVVETVASRQLFQVIVPTFKELEFNRDEYHDFENGFVDDGLFEDNYDLPKGVRIVRVLEEVERNDGELWYRAKFSNGNIMKIPFERLTAFEGGTQAILRFGNGRPQRHPSPDITGGSEEDETLSPVVNNARKTRQRWLISLRGRRRTEIASPTVTTEPSDEDISATEAGPASRGRRTTRSQGLGKMKMLAYKKGNAQYSDHDDGLVVSDLTPWSWRRSTRAATRNSGMRDFSKKRSRRRNDSEEDYGSEADEEATRRSGRMKRQKQHYAEVGVDDDFVDSDLLPLKEPANPRVLHSKEIFPVLDDDDEFILVHNQTCDTCLTTGHSNSRGKLICCQGCSAAYHKGCIGNRGTSREHLVTKISDENFVIQCKRCIGRYKLKDPLQASFDRCTSCSGQGRSCLPFKSLSARKKASDDRGLTPDTEVASDLLYGPENVLFRCSNCYRAWHYEHLPQRGSKRGRLGPDVRQQRIDQYTEDFKCIDCISAPQKISTIIAWRPADPASHLQDTRLDLKDFTEDEREYLIKDESESYFHVHWYPGAWVAGAFPGKKRSFLKNHPPATVTQGEAIDEAWLQVETVLDVEYTSVVPLSDVEVDVARIKEVKRAFLKYKGLGYDEVFWDAPPMESDTERWAGWEKAYYDYIHGLHVKPAKNTVKKMERARRTKFENLELTGQPQYIKGGTLMEYQKEGMNWLYYKWWSNQNAILADEMGLGKTIQIISFLAVLYEELGVWPFLIVVPHSTVPNWKREIQTWAPSLRVVAYYGADTARKISRAYEMFHKNGDLKCHIVVTSYSTPITDSAVLRRISWQSLIVDEGQRLKNDCTQLYIELQKYRICHKVLLTGTPLQNNPRELFNLLQFLEPKEINAQKLEEEYGELTSENVPRLHAVIRPFFLRRTKALVLTHLPPMAEVIVPVSMSALQRKLYKSILSKDTNLIRSILHRGGGLKQTERAKLNNLLMQLRKCVCHPFLYNEDIEEITNNDLATIHRNLVEAGSKLGLLNIMLPKLRERGHRVLLFSQFLGMLDIIEDFLNGLGLKFHRLDGSISTLDKQKRIDEFNAPGSSYFAFLLSTRAGGVGINLATADTVIILDPDFNPHQDIQALSRAHRIGQKNKVLVFHLMTRDTAEEKIMQIGKKKLSLDHLIIEKMSAGENGEVEGVIDVESILSFGAKRLFEDEAEDRVIKYDDESVDKLLDRSSMEQTKTTDESGDGSAKNAFSFARVWANDKGALEENGLGVEPTEDDGTPEPGFWERVLREREEEAQREAAANAQELGRGRRRKNVTYAFHGDDAVKDDSSDTDFQQDEQEHESEDSRDHAMGSDNPMGHSQFVCPVPKDPSLHQHSHQQHIPLATRQITPMAPMMGIFPLARSVPPPQFPVQHDARYLTQAPYDVLKDFTRVVPIVPTNMSNEPPCKACKHCHTPGSCTLKKSGIEHCPICGLAHLPKASSCPHLSSETQIDSMMQALQQSPEDKALVDEAKRELHNQKSRLQRETAAEDQGGQG